MSFYILSDLHTDYAKSIEDIPEYLSPWLMDADNLIVAGDISTNFDATVETLKYLGSVYENVYWVPGNHDYVPCENVVKNCHSFEYMEMLKKACSFSNVHCLDGTVKNSIGGTCGAYDFSYAEKHFGINRKIMLKEWENWYDGYKWKVNSYDEFQQNQNTKMEKLFNKNIPEIIVTHIGAKAEDIKNEFHNENTGFFYFDGTSYLDKMKNGYWIYGHTHDRHIMKHNDVTLLCNPLGYSGDNKADRKELEKFVFQI